MIFTETTEAVEPDDRLNGVLAAYLEALAGGEQPLQSDWLQQHPDFAVELREFFECWDAISELARPLRETQAILRTLTPPPQHVPTDSRPVETSAGPPSFYSPLPQDYELLEEMGRGGMGVVYKARAAELMVKIARAVDHAHQRGILHRDPKPSNVLLDGAGQPHVTDFGLARQLATESTLTGTGEMVGTPSYMSPEQASGKRQAITVATDVYGLGTVLYALLTGRPPFRNDFVIETLRQVCEQNPPAPHALNARVPRDLETICLKALDKSPAHRYPTAAALAEDLQRFLEGRSIHARVAPRRERILRWARRNPAPAALIAVVAIASFLSVAGLLMHDRRLAGMNTRLKESALTAQRHQHAAEESEQRARQLLYHADMKLAFQAWSDRNLPRATELLERQRPQTPGRDLRGFEWHYLWNAIHVQPAASDAQPQAAIIETAKPLYFVCYSRDGGGLATAGAESVIRIYDPATLQERIAIPTGQGEINGLDFSNDGLLIASAGDDGTVRLWDCENGREVLMIEAHPEKAYQVAFMRAGILSCGNDPVIRLWNPETGQLIASYEGHTDSVESISGDSSDIFTSASGDEDGQLKLWTGLEKLESEVHNLHFFDFRVIPHTSLVFGATAQQLVLWDASAEETVATLGLPDSFASVSVSADGALCAGGCRDGSVTIWNIRSRQPVARVPIDAPAVRLALSRDGRLLAAQLNDQDLIRVLDVLSGREIAEFEIPLIRLMAFSPDGNLLFVRATGNLPVSLL